MAKRIVQDKEAARFAEAQRVFDLALQDVGSVVASFVWGYLKVAEVREAGRRLIDAEKAREGQFWKTYGGRRRYCSCCADAWLPCNSKLPDGSRCRRPSIYHCDRTCQRHMCFRCGAAHRCETWSAMAKRTGRRAKGAGR